MWKQSKQPTTNSSMRGSSDKSQVAAPQRGILQQHSIESLNLPVRSLGSADPSVPSSWAMSDFVDVDELANIVHGISRDWLDEMGPKLELPPAEKLKRHPKIKANNKPYDDIDNYLTKPTRKGSTTYSSMCASSENQHMTALKLMKQYQKSEILMEYRQRPTGSHNLSIESRGISGPLEMPASCDSLDVNLFGTSLDLGSLGSALPFFSTRDASDSYSSMELLLEGPLSNIIKADSSEEGNYGSCLGNLEDANPRSQSDHCSRSLDTRLFSSDSTCWPISSLDIVNENGKIWRDSRDDSLRVELTEDPPAEKPQSRPKTSKNNKGERLMEGEPPAVERTRCCPKTKNGNRKSEEGPPKTEQGIKNYIEGHCTAVDVFMGRGGGVNNHPCNKAYLKQKDMMQGYYLAASKNEKTGISQKLVDWVHARGGRFLERDYAADGGGARYAEVDNRAARKKASQTLREDNTPENRARKRAKYYGNRT